MEYLSDLPEQKLLELLIVAYDDNCHLKVRLQCSAVQCSAVQCSAVQCSVKLGIVNYSRLV